VPFGEQHFGEVAADGADSASRAGYQDRPGIWPLRCHAASLGRLSGGAMIAGDGTGARWAVNPRIRFTYNVATSCMQHIQPDRHSASA
jgi:hypothetical protein